MAGRTDARGTMDIHPHVATVHEQRLSRVKSHSHPDRRLREPLLCALRARGCATCRTEDEEERIALSVDFNAVMLGRRLPDESLLFLQDVCVFGGADFAEQARRAFDIREEHGDGACGQAARHV